MTAIDEGDRCGREQHGATRRDHVRTTASLAVCAVSQLVAEAADHQQRVVDRQRQAHGGGEVECEYRNVGGKRDRAQHRKGAENRHSADGHRQRCCDQAAKYPDQHEEAEWNRDRFHHQQVALRLLGDLNVDHCGAACPHGGAVTVVRHLCRRTPPRISAGRFRFP